MVRVTTRNRTFGTPEAALAYAEQLYRGGQIGEAELNEVFRAVQTAERENDDLDRKPAADDPRSDFGATLGGRRGR
ncbi:hypothetical protein [Bradyrhizobium australafricanum]|uniref:hypothetical protein n=1 Tax=Bradyrhizobium australafricanum TaxID=2821406 RepID=UPI001CE312EB|nr:hypothetical protein [Bradyrhizobium australafricanum]MCA6102791.1 hypothetical protein [Bradyrhizobium australafricanum]